MVRVNRIIVLALAAALCLSCSPRIIERVSYQRDTTYITRTDSLWRYQKDSVFVKEKGDTVYKYVEHIRYRDRVRVDSFVRVVKDSVFVDRIKEVEVEKPLSQWKQSKLALFPWLLAGLLAALAYIFRKPIFALIKKII